MGSMNALGMADAIAQGQVTLGQAIRYHLGVNHYPPVPESMDSVALEAIVSLDNEDPDHLVALPEGVTWRGETSVPAWVVVDNFHLEFFLEAR